MVQHGSVPHPRANDATATGLTSFHPSGMIKRNNDIIEESQEDLNDDEVDQSPLSPSKNQIKEEDYEENTPSLQKLDMNSLDEENLSVGLGVFKFGGTGANRNANRIIGRGQP